MPQPSALRNPLPKMSIELSDTNHSTATNPNPTPSLDSPSKATAKTAPQNPEKHHPNAHFSILPPTPIIITASIENNKSDLPPPSPQRVNPNPNPHPNSLRKKTSERRVTSLSGRTTISHNTLAYPPKSPTNGHHSQFKSLTTLTATTRHWVSNHIHAPHKVSFQVMRKPQLLDVLGTIILVIIFVFALYMMLGDTLTPGEPFFVCILVWFCSMIGGYIVDKAKLPNLLGMLISGMVLKNLQYMVSGVDDLVEGLPASWSDAIRAIGLSVILMRSGLELDIPAVKKAGLSAVRLTILPGITEAIAVMFSGIFIFGMKPAMGLALGFTLAAVSPAVVVIGMFNLQKNGYGTKKGIPSLIVAAASFDDIVAISGFSIAVGFAISDPSHTLTATLLHGPFEIILGVLFGCTGGLIMSCTKIWSKRWKRTLCIFSLGMSFMFTALELGFSGAGAMGGLIMGMLTSVAWKKGLPTQLSKGVHEHYIHNAEGDLAMLWNYVCQPLLFGVIGSVLDFGLIPKETIPKSILVVMIGLVFRLPVAYFATYGKGLSVKERTFVSLSWIPKATVQAALCSVPLKLVQDNIAKDSEDFQEHEDWAYDILTTAILSILMTAPVGSILIDKLGTRWLSNDKDEEENEKKQKKKKIEKDSLVTAINGTVESGAEDDSCTSDSAGNNNGKVDETTQPLTAKNLDETSSESIHELISDNTNIKSHLLQKLSTLTQLHHLNSNATSIDPVISKRCTDILLDIRQVLELCTLEGAETRVHLDTVGNFFKVAESLENRGSAAVNGSGGGNGSGTGGNGGDDDTKSPPGERRKRTISAGEESAAVTPGRLVFKGDTSVV